MSDQKMEIKINDCDWLLKLIDTIKDDKIVTVTTKAICLKNIPTIPVTNITGANITTVVKDEDVIADLTSIVAKTAASAGFSPLSICFIIFSRTTIALSTTIPILIAKAINVIIFRVIFLK